VLEDGALQSESGGVLVCEGKGVRGRGSGAAGGGMPGPCIGMTGRGSGTGGGIPGPCMGMA
jgi:hypothetical protein